MLVNIKGVAQPPCNGRREIKMYCYASEDRRPTSSEVRDARMAHDLVRRLTEGDDGFFIDATPPRGHGYSPMWIVQISVANSRRGTAGYRVGYHKYNGCPLAAIDYMMEIYRAIKRIIKRSHEELEKERKEQKEKKENGK